MGEYRLRIENEYLRAQVKWWRMLSLALTLLLIVRTFNPR